MIEFRSSKSFFLVFSAVGLVLVSLIFILTSCQRVPSELTVITTSTGITRAPTSKGLETNPTRTPTPKQIQTTATPQLNTQALHPSHTSEATSFAVIEPKLQWSIKAVMDVEWSPNSERFVAVLERETDLFGLQLYGVQNEKEIWFTEDQADDVVFNPTGNLIIATSTFYGLREFDVAEGNLIKSIDDPYNCLGGHEIAMAEDGKSVYTGYSPHVSGSTPHTSTIFQWDTSSEQCLGEIMSWAGWLRSMLMSPDSQNLVFVFSHLENRNDIRTVVWGIETESEMCSFGGVVPAFESNGNLYVTSYSDEGKVNLWNVTECKIVSTLNVGHNPYSLAISPEGKLLITGGSSIKVWDTSSGDLVHEQKNIPNEVQHLAFSPDGKHLISVHPAKRLDDTAKIILWNVNQ